MSAPVMPPEEKFWQRHSPHNEFSLSGVGTLTVYVLLGLVILGGVKLSGLLTPAQDFSMGALASDFEEGDGAGVPNPSTPREAVQPPQIERPAILPTADPLSLPRPPVGEVVSESTPAKPEDGNPPAETTDLPNRFGKIGEGIPGSLQGENRPGKPGGPKPGNLENKPRVAAMQRWNMVFDTKNGDDYRKQLASLGAILAFRDNSGQVWVIRKLTPPVQPAVEDWRKLQGISWEDDNPQSVRNLAAALGLPEAPAGIAAFFPAELEQKLTALEKKFAGNRPLANVKETRFRILLNKQGAYEPVVVEQR